MEIVALLAPGALGLGLLVWYLRRSAQSQTLSRADRLVEGPGGLSFQYSLPRYARPESLHLTLLIGAYGLVLFALTLLALDLVHHGGRQDPADRTRLLFFVVLFGLLLWGTIWLQRRGLEVMGTPDGFTVTRWGQTEAYHFADLAALDPTSEDVRHATGFFMWSREDTQISINFAELGAGEDFNRYFTSHLPRS